MRDVAARRSVRAYVRTMSAGVQRIASPVMSAASRIAVPVAESQLRLKTAASGADVATTGGTRITAWSSPVTGNLGAAIALRAAFTCGSPHTKTRKIGRASCRERVEGSGMAGRGEEAGGR